MDKRIREIRTVQKSTINIKEGTATLYPKKEQHIDIDDAKKAVKDGGFTPREVWVALVGKLIERNSEMMLSIVSTDKEKGETETKYLLKENKQLKQLLASIKLPAEKVFIAGKAVKATSDKDKDSPYTIIIEKFVAFPKEKS